MSLPRPGDISIGENRWISYIDISKRKESAIELDPLLVPLEPFLADLETNCVAGCCGLDAFSLWPADVQRASNLQHPDKVRSGLSSLRAFIETSNSDAFVSSRLNQYFERTVILQLIDHLFEHLATPESSATPQKA